MPYVNVSVKESKGIIRMRDAARETRQDLRWQGRRKKCSSNGLQKHEESKATAGSARI